MKDPIFLLLKFQKKRKKKMGQKLESFSKLAQLYKAEQTQNRINSKKSRPRLNITQLLKIKVLGHLGGFSQVNFCLRLRS